MEILLLVIALVILIGIRWVVIMGTIWAICQCFGFSFSMIIATIISIVWLAFLIIYSILKVMGDE